MKIRRAAAVIAAGLIGVVVGVLVCVTVGMADESRIQVLEGEAWLNQEGTAIGLSPDGETPGPGYVVAGAMWREQSGPWHDTFPTCLEPLVAGQRVRLGILEARPHGDAPGRPVVVWVECLE